MSYGEFRFFAKQLAAGLCHLHQYGLIHCDLKPENVLLTKEMDVKIGDLGLAEEQAGDGIK